MTTLLAGKPRALTAPAGDWVYLGPDAVGMLAWERALGPSWTRRDAAGPLEAEADTLRRPYADWVDALSRIHGQDPDWWTTTVAERNPLASAFFFEACCLSLLRRWEKSGRLPQAVVCGNGPLLAAARALLFPASAATGLGGRADAAVQGALLVARALQTALATASARLACSLTRRGGPAFPPSSRPRALVATFVHPESFDDEGRFSDRYFRSLHGKLEAAGYEVWVLPILVGLERSRLATVRTLRACGARVILPEDWLHWPDHLAAWRGSWRSLSLPRTAPPLDGLDVSSLLAAVRRRQARSRESLEARLLHALIPRLAAAGFKPALVLSWFENQRHEKALAAACRKAFPDADHAGYYSMLPSPNNVANLPTAAEREAGVLPRRIVCCGRHQASVLASLGSGIPIEVGPALRYEYLWEEAPLPPAPAVPTALLALHNRLDEAVELVETLRPVFDMDTGVRRWRVRLHPDYTRRELEAALGRPWPPALEEGPKDLRSSLAESSVVLSASSGVLVEAACLGRPVVVLARLCGLGFNPLAYVPDLGAPRASAAEIAAAVRAAVALPPEGLARLRDRGSALKDECFAPVSERTLAALVPPPAGPRP
ncbi:hypothetical protein EPO15_08805 [bacterium]|nr:MAG: hypothetical protein EPO15_08805 [bacterium]